MMLCICIYMYKLYKDAHNLIYTCVCFPIVHQDTYMYMYVHTEVGKPVTFYALSQSLLVLYTHVCLLHNVHGACIVLVNTSHVHAQMATEFQETSLRPDISVTCT